MKRYNTFTAIHLHLLFFHPCQIELNMCYYINQICCCPGNTQNFRTDRRINFFRRHIAIQIGHAINKNGKGISFIKQLCCISSVMVFYWNVLKQGFYKDLHFPSVLSNSSLLNLHRSFINLKIFENIRAFRISNSSAGEDTSFHNSTKIRLS